MKAVKYYISETREKKFFAQSEEFKYAKYKSLDPYPKIAPALLNSSDILKYIKTVGIIDNFNHKDLSGATYSCRARGGCLWFDDNRAQHIQTAEDEREIEIKPNSITFIEIGHTFRVPDYMALRFNLRVRHVYKGLLVGTGPIIDPGFVGRINIPLHNLTSNTYRIKKGARLIDVEFTKLSNNALWEGAIDDCERIKSTVPYELKEIPSQRDLSEYIKNALTDREVYMDSERPKAIVSALVDEVGIMKEAIVKSEKSSKTVEEKIDKLEKADRLIKGFSIIAIASLLLATVGMITGIYSYFSNSKKLDDSIKSLDDAMSVIQRQEALYNELEKRYEERISQLEEDITRLETQNTQASG